MSDTQVEFGYTGSALPGNAEVVVILATAPTSGVLTGVIGGAGNQGQYFQKAKIRRIVVGLINDQAGTYKEYVSADRGVTWTQISSTAVAAIAANSQNIHDFFVEHYRDWKLTWTNGATPQTSFSPNIVGSGQRVVAN
jgi:hypothetical protein